MAHDATKYSAVWGVDAARGFADGDSVTITFDNDEWTPYTGSQGEGTLVYSPKGSGTATLRIQGNSNTNTKWGLVYDAKKPLPLTILDKGESGMVFFASEAMPKKKPDTARGESMAIVEWVFTFVNGKQEYTAGL